MWATGAVGPRRCAGVQAHDIAELAVRDLQQRRHLVFVDLERQRDHVIVLTLVSEPDCHGVRCGEQPDSGQSIHAFEGTKAQVKSLQYAVLRFGGCAYSVCVAGTRSECRRQGGSIRHAQLDVGVVEMVLDRARRQVHPLGDLLGRTSRGGECRHLPLAIGEPTGARQDVGAGDPQRFAPLAVVFGQPGGRRGGSGLVRRSSTTAAAAAASAANHHAAIAGETLTDVAQRSASAVITARAWSAMARTSGLSVMSASSARRAAASADGSTRTHACSPWTSSPTMPACRAHATPVRAAVRRPPCVRPAGGSRLSAR